jgi:hypothetical protein
MTALRSFQAALIPILMLACSTSPARAETPKAAPVTVPFELLKSKHIAVKVMINGKGPYRLILDTGAPFTLINTRTARSSGMIAKDKKAPFPALFNSMGAVQMKSFELGETKIEDSMAAVMDHPTVELISKALGPIEGLVGFPFFARYKMTIDYQAKEITLTPSGYQPTAGDSDPTAMARRMLEGKQDGPRILVPAAQWGFLPAKEKTDEEPGIEVKQVFAGSAAAEAGLKPGDRVLTLDGRWTDSLTDSYQAASFVKAGSKVKLLIKRDGKEKELTITPRAGL